jgi:uncharacterized membrane protein
MVEYPRKGVWSVGFVTGKVSDMIQSQFDKPMLSVFIPTTPSPTSGLYAVIPAEEVITLSLSIEDAFKILISGGIVSPNTEEIVHINDDKTSVFVSPSTNEFSPKTTSEMS